MPQSTKTDDNFLTNAQALLGPRGMSQDPELLAPWLTDWRGRFTGRALALAAPANTEEVASLVKLCAAHDVAIVPQGGNSGMSGGATPDASGRALLLSLRRLTRLDAIDTASDHIICGAGVVLQTLHEAVGKVGKRFPLSLGGKGSATVGGLIATNAGGTQVLRHGTMRALVTGLEVVLADGRICSMLTPLKKDNRGYDLKQLFIGSEGTLCVITAATLRLVPAITDRRVIWAGVSSLHAARALLLHCQQVAHDTLEGFEVLPHASLKAVLGWLAGSRSPLTQEHQWYALIEMVADNAGSDTLGERCETMIADAFTPGLIEDAVIAANETQAEAFWALRENIAPAERAQGPAVQHDISVPVAAMPDFVTEARAVIETDFPGTRTVAFGHLGDGNVHFHVIAPSGTETTMTRAAWETGDGKRISAAIYDMVAAWGGSISAEHGIGQLKIDELTRLGDPVTLDIMHRIKAALDPAGLLNPGKLLR